MKTFKPVLINNEWFIQQGRTRKDGTILIVTHSGGVETFPSENHAEAHCLLLKASEHLDEAFGLLNEAWATSGAKGLVLSNLKGCGFTSDKITNQVTTLLFKAGENSESDPRGWLS